MDEARELFSRNGLPFPPVPDELASQVRRRSEWWFTTRGDDAPPPYFLEESVRRFLTGEAGDGFVLAHAGHGVSSWAIHYYLTFGTLGIFVQSSWGGADADDDRATREKSVMAARFEAAGQLLAHSPDAFVQAFAGQPAVGRRCTVVVTDFGTSRWALDAPGSAPQWHATPDAFREVLAAAG